MLSAARSAGAGIARQEENMKKKTVRPLTLSKETIRDLNEARMENVAGGRTGASDCPAHCINNTVGGSVPPCG